MRDLNNQGSKEEKGLMNTVPRGATSRRVSKAADKDSPDPYDEARSSADSFAAQARAILPLKVRILNH